MIWLLLSISCVTAAYFLDRHLHTPPPPRKLDDLLNE